MANEETVDSYIAAQPETVRPILETVRAAIRSAVPEAVEVISYRIPAYRVGGRVAIFFAGWKNHFSLYPAREALLAAFGTELMGLEISKGTIRFPLDQTVPVELIARLARFKADEALDLSKTRKARAKAKAA